LDSTGAVGRKNTIQQRHGVILNGENQQQMNGMHPPHHNADKHPPHATRTALNVCRVAELKAAAMEFGERAADLCAPVDQPRPPDHRTRPRGCPIENVRERAEADHRVGRARGGLFADGAPVNPEREHKMVGMEYVEAPLFATRCQLNETRRELNKMGLEEQRLRGEETSVDIEVQRSIKDAMEYDFRRPDHVPMTCTRLKEQRRQDRIEHNMANFEQPRACPREYPKFSDDSEVPFWLAGPSGKRRPETAPASPAISKAVSEPALKLTDEVPFGHMAQRPVAAELAGGALDVAEAIAAGRSSGYTLGSRVVKRWAADMLDRGCGLNKPRLFDGLPRAGVGPKDLEHLELSSSLEPVRREARRRLAEAHGAKTVKRSALFLDNSHSRSSLGSDLEDGLAEASRFSRGSGARGFRMARSRMRAPPQIDLDKLGTASDPRCFGSPAHIQKPTSQTGVRTGGFAQLRLMEEA